jgi:FtsZ-interacting cell division protein ZipA
MSGMDTVTIVIIIVVVVVVLALLGALLANRRKQRSEHLRDRFGPEYDQAVQGEGSRRKGEHDLADREERHEQREIRDLDPEARQRYAESWSRIQAHFVDEPLDAVKDAQVLIRDVMTERGYPADDQEQTEGLSVEHPEVMGDYRAAERIVRASREGSVTTEQLREAMLGFRSLAERLLNNGTAAPESTTTRDSPDR